MRPRVIIWGAAGHARVVADIIRLSGRYELAGFLDDVRPERAGEVFEGATIVGGRDRLPRLLEDGVHDLIVAFGDCRARVDAARFAARLGFSLATAIHPSAVVAGSARLGCGTIVAANAVVNPGTAIGENVIVNTSSSVDHDCIVEDGAHSSKRREESESVKAAAVAAHAEERRTIAARFCTAVRRPTRSGRVRPGKRNGSTLSATENRNPDIMVLKRLAVRMIPGCIVAGRERSSLASTARTIRPQ